MQVVLATIEVPGKMELGVCVSVWRQCWWLGVVPFHIPHIAEIRPQAGLQHQQSGTVAHSCTPVDCTAHVHRGRERIRE